MRIILSHYLKSLHYNIIRKIPQQKTHHYAFKRFHSVSSTVESNNLSWRMKWNPIWMATSAGLAMALVSYASLEREADTTSSYNITEHWIADLENIPGTVLIENPRKFIKQNNIIKNVISSNHMVHLKPIKYY